MKFSSFIEKSHQVEQSCIAPSTAKSYAALLRSYEATITKIEDAPAPFPLTEEKVRGFLCFYRERNPNTTFCYLKQFVVAFANHLRSINQPDFTKTQSFLTFMKGLRHQMKSDSPPNAKLYVTREIMDKIINSHETTEEMNAFVSISYYGFLRISETLNIRLKDVSFDEEGRIMLLIPYSKNDQNGKTATVFINKTTTSYSPFKWFISFIDSKKSEPPNSKIFDKSATTYRKRLKKIFESIGIDTGKYSSHSFRKGAAHEAALAGINDTNIKAMGRWASSCYTIYTATTMREAADKISSFI